MRLFRDLACSLPVLSQYAKISWCTSICSSRSWMLHMYHQMRHKIPSMLQQSPAKPGCSDESCNIHENDRKLCWFSITMRAEMKASHHEYMRKMSVWWAGVRGCNAMKVIGWDASIERHWRTRGTSGRCRGHGGYKALCRCVKKN